MNGNYRSVFFGLRTEKITARRKSQTIMLLEQSLCHPNLGNSQSAIDLDKTIRILSTELSQS